MAQIALHCYVSGRVQGVGYRAAAQRKARELGLTGQVRNLADKRVEVMLCGEENQVNVMREWLWKGPLFAKVNAVDCNEIAWQANTSFDILD